MIHPDTRHADRPSRDVLAWKGRHVRSAFAMLQAGYPPEVVATQLMRLGYVVEHWHSTFSCVPS